MKDIQRSAILNISFAVPISLFATVSSAKDLNGEEVKALISDKTVESKYPRKGFSITTYYALDGTFRQIKKGEFRKGSWCIDSNRQLCSTAEGGSGSCRLIAKEGDSWKAYKIPVNVMKPRKHERTILKIVDGTPNNL